jgi:PKD repeat protein
MSTLVPLLAEHGVDIVFSGHAHLYERAQVGDVMYVISGGGGEPLYSGPLNPYSAYYTSTYHCVLVTINGRSLTSVGVRPDGVEFDPFTLYNPPVAAFESSSPGWLGQTILFTNTTLTSGATSYEWALGDGAESTEKNPTHAYMLPGLYTVTLTATNPAGSHRAVAMVEIYGAPAASFTAYPIKGPRPLTVVFTDETTTGPLADPTLIHLWQFGDGQTSALRDPTHTYTVAQVYTVTLAVTNAAGSSMVERANYVSVYVPLNVYLPLILSHSSGP